MRKLLPLLAAAAASCLPVLATSYFFVPDVPTDLGGTTYLPWEIVRNDSGVYSLRLALPPDTAVDGLHMMCNGDWLFSVEAAAELPPGSGVFFDRRDVVRYVPSTGTYNLFFSGAGAGIPDGSDTQASYLNGNDAAPLILSFDVPTTIGGTTYDPADLVRYQAGLFALQFDGSSATPPIPDAVDVPGADRRGARTLLTFDVPATLGPTFLPGEVTQWDGTAFTSWYADPNWPSGSGLTALALPPDPGRVPPPTLQVDRSMLVPGNLRLSWGASTSAGAEDYGIYEGTIGTWFGHAAIDCTDNGGDRTEDVSPQPASSYYLVVPLNGNDEGSYGWDSSGLERPPGVPACRPTQGLDCP